MLPDTDFDLPVSRRRLTQGLAAIVLAELPTRATEKDRFTFLTDVIARTAVDQCKRFEIGAVEFAPPIIDLVLDHIIEYLPGLEVPAAAPLQPSAYADPGKLWKVAWLDELPPAVKAALLRRISTDYQTPVQSARPGVQSG